MWHLDQFPASGVRSHGHGLLPGCESSFQPGCSPHPFDLLARCLQGHLKGKHDMQSAMQIYAKCLSSEKLLAFVTRLVIGKLIRIAVACCCMPLHAGSGGEVKRKVGIVGKGLTFDSGGYNLKAGAGPAAVGSNFVFLEAIMIWLPLPLAIIC